MRHFPLDAPTSLRYTRPMPEQYALLPSYSCHKTVKAARITGVQDFDDEHGAVLFLDLKAINGDGGVETKVSVEWVVKHSPGETSETLVGGYFVAYGDGYTSWSPAEAFEGGYARCNEVLGTDGGT